MQTRGRGKVLQTYSMDDPPPPPQGNSNKVLQKGRQAENTVAAFNEQIASYIIKKALIAPAGRAIKPKVE